QKGSRKLAIRQSRALAAPMDHDRAGFRVNLPDFPHPITQIRLKLFLSIGAALAKRNDLDRQIGVPGTESYSYPGYARGREARPVRPVSPYNSHRAQTPHPLAQDPARDSPGDES